MKIISVVSSVLGLGQSEGAYKVAKIYSKERDVQLIDCSDEIYSKNRYFFGSKKTVKDFLKGIDYSLIREENLCLERLNYLVINKLATLQDEIPCSSENTNSIEKQLEQDIIINCSNIIDAQEFEAVLNSSDKIIIPIRVDRMWRASTQFDKLIDSFNYSASKVALLPLINLDYNIDYPLNSEDQDRSEISYLEIVASISSYALEKKYTLLDTMEVNSDKVFYKNMSYGFKDAELIDSAVIYSEDSDGGKLNTMSFNKNDEIH